MSNVRRRHDELTKRRMSIDSAEIECECCLCQRQILYSIAVFHTRKAAEWYGLIICHDCEQINQRGIVVTSYPHLLQHLAKLRIKLVLDHRGRVRLPDLGPKREFAAAA